jgi:tetratricopeptide (TPR) repeat protein
VAEQAVPAQARRPVWGPDIPRRNRHFVGREQELRELRRFLLAGATALIGQPDGDPRDPPADGDAVQALYGMGGIGKTELATEYAHRHRDDYDLIWWFRAEQPENIAAGLVTLGHTLGLAHVRTDARDRSTGVVMEALIAGDPYDRWLLIFDDARDAGVLGQYIPQAREHGHVIITSRNIRWQALKVDGIELREFHPDESIELLRRRVPQLGYVRPPDGADEREIARCEAEGEQRRSSAAELAAELGNLPLAVEHAAAYLKEEAVPVKDYLKLYRQDAHALLTTDVNLQYRREIAVTWSLATHAISAEAAAVFQLLAFFGPEPIAEELLRRPGAALPADHANILNDVSKLRPALRELGRYSLIRTGGAYNSVQMHRVVQAVTRDRLRREDPDRANQLQAGVHELLAASDPQTPDRAESGHIYDRSREHIVPSGALDSANPAVRQLIINQVRHLHEVGGYAESLALGEQALARWREIFDDNGKLTLTLAVEVGVTMRSIGRWVEAYQLNSFTLAALKQHFGTADDIYLICARSYDRDLSMLGRDKEALASDLQLLPLYEEHLGPVHEDTLLLKNNIAVGLRSLGRFEEALRIDEEVLAEREHALGGTDEQTLISRFAVARDLRRLGRYEDALSMIQQVNDTLERENRYWNLFRLQVGVELEVALRRVGQYEDARTQGEMILERHYELVGEDHRRSLAAATCVVNDRRLAGELESAAWLGERTVEAWEKAAGPDHPNTQAARANLAIVMRAQNQLAKARELDEAALVGFKALYGEEHPSTLVVMTNLASDLVAVGNVRRARELGERALELSRRIRGENHPSTLVTAANLSLDRRATGDEQGASELREQTIPALERAFGRRHPQVVLATQEGRLSMDINPMTT